MNNITLIGRLTGTAELKATQGGKSVCSFGVAVDRAFTGSDGKRQADFFPIVAWGKTAEFISGYFTKGQKIGLVGRLQSRSYEDKNGIKRTAIEVIAEHAEFIEKKAENSIAGVKADEFEEVDIEEDLPF